MESADDASHLLTHRRCLHQFPSDENDSPIALEYLKLLEPPEGDGDLECQCCFSEEHLVSPHIHPYSLESPAEPVSFSNTWFNAMKAICSVASAFRGWWRTLLGSTRSSIAWMEADALLYSLRASYENRKW
jgi:hypothetical protein